MTIPYELARQLRDKGFPFKPHHLGVLHMDGYTPANIPTLSELIEACIKPDNLFNMIRTPAGWSCDMKEHVGDAYPTAVALNYSTPEEAVANLWLKLHEISP